MKSAFYAVIGLAVAIGPAGAAEPFSINDALLQAAHTNPGVGEASANRRATESELRQTQSTLLPQVRLEARYGPEKFDQSAAVSTGTALPVPVQGAGSWRNGSQESVVVRQILFDGFSSIHDIWRQSARVNAAAFRVRERTELIALDAAEAYIDVVRYLRLVGPAKVISSRPANALRTPAPNSRNLNAAWTTPARSIARLSASNQSTCVFRV